MPATRDEMYTVVENLMDVDHVFSFLTPRGLRLSPGEVVAIPGDIRTTLAAQQGDRRNFKALERSLATGRLRLRSSPMPLFWDDTDDRAYGLSVQNGVLGTVDPSYESGDSDSFSAA